MAIDRIDGDDVASGALREHLLRVDHQLKLAGVGRQERDTTLRQIAEQFYDQLGAEPSAATRDDVRAALAALGSELAYRGDEPTVGQLLRMLWVRLLGGTYIPLMLNDGGRKRTLWPELIKRLGFMWVIMFGGMLVILPPLMGRSAWTLRNVLPLALMATCSVLMLLVKLRRTPVEALPLAEDWPAAVRGRHRWAWIVMFTLSALCVLLLYPAAYVVAAVATNRPILPVHQPTFLAAMLVTGALCMGVAGLDAVGRRLARRRVERWATPATR